MRVCALIAVLVLAPATQAKEGFSLTLGVGGGIWSLDEGSLKNSLAEIGLGDAANLTGSLEDGLAARFALAYNIMGYASIELGITGHGWNLAADDQGGSGHVSVVAHFHPLQLWFPERDYDATVFLGGGYSIIGGGRADKDPRDDRGMDGGALEVGFTGRYFFTPWFSLGGEVRFTVPFFSRWVVDWEDGVDFDFETSPDGFFVSLLLVTTFHFQASSQ